MTLREIEEINTDFLLASDVAPVLKVAPQSIRMQAKVDPAKLGFPVVVAGRQVRIPKDAFIKWIKGE